MESTGNHIISLSFLSNIKDCETIIMLALNFPTVSGTTGEETGTAFKGSCGGILKKYTVRNTNYCITPHNIEYHYNFIM